MKCIVSSCPNPRSSRSSSVGRHTLKRVLILGAGVSGHTAASYIKKWAGRKAEVIVMTPNSKWNWIPSNIWVGVDMMTTDDVTFDLAPVYKKAGITFVQALAQTFSQKVAQTMKSHLFAVCGLVIAQAKWSRLNMIT